MTGTLVVRGITIDGPTSRDLDDAIWVDRNGGGYTVTVSVAGVGLAVPAGSDADMQARARGTTQYLARGTIPMLPARLETALSLLEGQRRATVSIILELDEAFEVCAAPWVALTELTSEARLCYAHIPDLLEARTHPLHDMIVLAERVAGGLFQRRRERGAITFRSDDGRWLTTEEGHLKRAERREDTSGQVLVQEFMILANTWLAIYADSQDLPLPVLYRVHAPSAHGADRQAVLEALRVAVGGADVAAAEAIWRLNANLLGRAVYSAQPGEHFGLSLLRYLHGTSPLRRYADLVTQRALVAHLRGAPQPHASDELAAIATHLAAITAREHQEHVAAACAKAERRIAARAFEGLPPKEFERVLKVAARAGLELVPELEAAVLRRQDDEQLSLTCCAVIFFEAPALPRWGALRAELLHHLEGHPHDAVSLLSQAAQTHGWRPVDYTTAAEGPPHARTFTATARAEAPRPEAVVATAKTAVEAKQWAALRLLSRLTGGPDLAPPPLPTPAPAEVSVPVSVNGHNPIGVLQERAQARGHKGPTYSFLSKGPAHAPTFTCICRYGGTERAGSGASKPDAKRSAAYAMLQHLGELQRSPQGDQA
jgi:ribonuclease R